MKKLLIVVVLFSAWQTVLGQTTKTTRTSSQTWTQYFLTARLSEHWGFYFDGGLRFNEFFGDKTQLLLRPGITYHLNSNVSFTAGYTHFQHYEAFTGNDEVRPEDRLWQQVLMNGKLGKLSVNHRYRLEERWQKKMAGGVQTEGWNYNFRMRYQINISYPLKGDKMAKGVPYLVAYDEIMFNFGKEIVYNTFDQNRIYFGGGYNITDKLACTLGYQWVYSQRKSGTQYESVNCVRLVVVQQLDFRKKDK